MMPPAYAPGLGDRGCSICGEAEPWHVHDGDRRIDDYFTVGRGQTDIEAARAWKERALSAERKLALLERTEVSE